MGREIADTLSLSRRTVEHHLERAMSKLGVQRKSELVDRWPSRLATEHLPNH
jgi:DNA-binding CsgD family transcriptional regulator